MNPSTAQSTVLVDALVACGVTDAVLSPGSRSAPLAFALAAAERAGRIRLHVRIDERSAGFLALGLAKASGRPVPLVVTSGTAVANLFPAVVEASFTGVPLVILSADRPPVLRGVGASQTIDQVKIFGNNVRHFVDVAVATDNADQVGYWRSLIGRAAAAAADPADPGPVHLNLPFAEPLVPGDGPRAPEAPTRGAPWIRPFAPIATPVPLADVLHRLGFADIPERGLVIVGDVPDVGWDGAREVAALAQACGWPIIAEPSAGLHGAPTWIPGGPLILGSRTWMADHDPELIVSVGRVGLTRQVSGLLESAQHHLVIDRTSRWADPTHTAAGVLIGSVPTPGPELGRSQGAWLTAWRRAASLAAGRVDEVLQDQDIFTGLHVARHVWRSVPDDALLFLAASWPIRQAYLTARARTGLRTMANRGANGIDGLVSTAWGAALSHHADFGGPTVALLGDLAFLHDGNGLLGPAGEDRPALTYVVIDNDGGGIFSQLEQAAPAYADDFERIFGTPHGLHLVGRSRLSGIPARGVQDLASFAAAMADRPAGVSVLVAEVADRAGEAQLLRQLQLEVARSLRQG